MALLDTLGAIVGLVRYWQNLYSPLIVLFWC